jgi:putative cell wall-binding protein
MPPGGSSSGTRGTQVTHRTTHASTWRRQLAAVAASLALALTLVTAGPPVAAEAGPAPTKLDQLTVAPGLVRQVYRYQGERGGVDVQVLRLRPEDPRVTLRPELGKGDVPGMEATHEAVTRLAPEGAIAGVNAHFFSWSGTPAGDPVGMMVRDGQYVSQPERGSIWRGGFGIQRDGGVVFGHPAYGGTIRLPEKHQPTFPINAVNRWPKPPTTTDPERREITAFTPSYGNTTGTPAGTVEVQFRDYVLDPTHRRTATVVSTSSSGNVNIPSRGIVVAATGNFGKEILEQLQPGDTVELAFEVSAGWEDLWQAVQGGPMLLTNGARTGAASWEREGFDPRRHSDARHPRTAVAKTGGGELLLVTMDGRSSRSAGLSMRDAQTLLLHLGARDAVMMDGGGSTQMVVDNTLVNRPSDSSGFRRVATNMVVYSHRLREPDVRRIGEGDHYRIAADVARTGWPGGSRTVLLASGQAFPDALAGGPLAAKRDLPILLTTPTRVPTATMQALRDLGTTDVIVLGGTAAVDESVESQLQRAGLRPRRVFGVDRVATAARLARILGAANGVAFVVSAESWPDSASATVPAALAGAPVLLTPRDALHQDTAEALAAIGAREVVVAGGNQAVGDRVVTQLRDLGYRVERVAGRDRFATSAALATWSQQRGGVDAHTAMLARGDEFPVALVAGPLGAKERKAVLLVDRFGLERSPASNGWLHAHDLASLTILGDRTTMSSWLGYQAQLLLER